MAKANYDRTRRPQVLSKRTRTVARPADAAGGRGTITEVYVQTFENGSPKSIRIYQIHEDASGSVLKAEMTGTEGPVGP
jgi:hypothetical protein